MTELDRSGQDRVMEASIAQEKPRPALPALGGTRSAAEFRRVFDVHHDFVWRSLLHLGVPNAFVDDALQEVFLVVHRRLSDFDPSQAERAWLWGIARHVASNQRRSIGRDVRRKDALVSMASPPASSPDEGELGLVREILLAMDEPTRDLLVLSDVEGLTAVEIASALELNVNTVYSRLRAARARFAAEAHKRGLGPGGDDGR